MIKFYEFPSTDTLVVLDTEKGLAALFQLNDIKRKYTSLKTWWGAGDVTSYITWDFEGVLEAIHV